MPKSNIITTKKYQANWFVIDLCVVGYLTNLLKDTIGQAS